MKLYEYEGKFLFQKMGIPVPKGEVFATPKKIEHNTGKLRYPLVIKAQVLSGGRGKAGGIKFAQNKKEALEIAGGMFGRRLLDEEVKKILIEEKASEGLELYAGITLSPQLSMPILMMSTKGGMDIEDLATTFPDAILEMALNPTETLTIDEIVDFVSSTDLEQEYIAMVADILMKLVDSYFHYEAITAEINPLVITAEGKVIAVDAKLEIDESALGRNKEVLKLLSNGRDAINLTDELEVEAKKNDIAYVPISNGNIGLIAGGAGLGMASIDMIKVHGGEPANFLDLGGNATTEKTASALRIVLKKSGVKGILINVFGGINNCEEMAKGIVSVIDELKPEQTIVVKMRGHAQENGWSLLKTKSIPIIKHGTTEEAVLLLYKEMTEQGVDLCLSY